MDMRDYVGPSYIKYPDVVDAPRQERIVAIQEGSFGCKDLKFASGDLLSLNKTNARTLVRAHGWESNNWIDLEYGRNGERYRFLKWGQGSFDNFRVVPPGTGICHQVNLEYLAQTVWTRKEKYAPPRGKAATVEVAYPDTLVGTDSHTTMVNGLSVLGWGVGGIEAEACMLGQPLSMLLPEVIGFRLTGGLGAGRDRHRSRSHRHPDAAAKRAWSANSSNFMGPASIISRSPIARRSPIWRRNMARPAASSRSIRRRSLISRHRRARRRASLSSKPMRRRKGSFAPRRRPIPSSPIR